ncbi:AfsR/SARP family transcriptional regulator [Micromonospora costi]|uniref:AfsR/SARP family transcriptional regulator n=1 Tax=Micromonospora costi TaxID=1530042 RepID=UPI0033FC2C6E
MVAIDTKTAYAAPAPRSDGDATSATFRILGPLEIHGPAKPVTPRGARQRIVLATLLLRANTVVAMEKIVDQLWPHHVPSTAREQVPIVVSGLRRLLRDAGTPGTAGVLLTRRPGYVLQLAPTQLDAHRFESLLRDADRALAADRHVEAVRLLESALSLWRGDALTGVPSGQAFAEAQRLAELRLCALEKLVDSQLALGQHRQLVPRLSQLVAAHPLRERLRGQLMIALNAVGRRAEALETYRVGRRLMVTELGLEPGAELRRIERALLADDAVHSIAEVSGPSRASTAPSRTAPARSDPALARAAVDRPAQLPPDLYDFTGRRREIDEIRRAIGDAPAPAPVIAIAGPPGVGASALATHAGHLLRGHFPDGQLHVELHASGERPRDVSQTLASLIASFGVPAATIPEGLSERVRMFRAVTERRRVLVVVDDVRDVSQVRPFTPSGPGCALLVTGRRRLPDLAGARHVPLDMLPTDDALALLGHILGPDRVAAEPLAAARIVDRCGHLPLALRIAGARLVARPHWSLTTLARRLAAPQRRLDELRVEDLDVRATLASAVRRLPPRVALAARRLALLDGPDVATRAVAEVLGTSFGTAEETLDLLAQHHVLVPARAAGSRRYRLPTLTRLYLREQPTGTVGQAPAA